MSGGLSQVGSSIVSAFPQAGAEGNSFKKLSKVEIFREMKKSICSIEVGTTCSSGFFLNEKIVISTFHSAEGIVVEDDDGSLKANDVAIKIFFNGERCKGTPFKGSNSSEDHFFKKAFGFDLVSFNADSYNEGSSFPIIDFDLEEGMAVYFGGFPLSQKIATFHKGMISSISGGTNGVPQHFTIDGTVVPGNSGGPVLVQKEGKLYLAGVIVSEIADLDTGFKPRNSILGLIGTSEKSDEQRKVIVQYDNGKEEEIDQDEALIKAVLEIQRNISTGIGKAIDARAILELLNATDGSSLANMEIVDQYSVGKDKKFTDDNNYHLLEAKDGKPGVYIDSHQRKHSPSWPGRVGKSGTIFRNLLNSDIIRVAEAFINDPDLPFKETRASNGALNKIYWEFDKHNLAEDLVKKLKDDKISQINIDPAFRDGNWYVHFNPVRR